MENKDSFVPKSILIDSYKMHLHAIQNLNTNYHFVIEIYPVDNTILQQPIMIVSQSVYPGFEYAIESGIDTLESLGFLLVEKTIIDVYEIKGNNYIKKLVEFDGDEFNIASETEVDQDDYFDKFYNGNRHD